MILKFGAHSSHWKLITVIENHRYSSITTVLKILFLESDLGWCNNSDPKDIRGHKEFFEDIILNVNLIRSFISTFCSRSKSVLVPLSVHYPVPKIFVSNFLVPFIKILIASILKPVFITINYWTAAQRGLKHDKILSQFTKTMGFTPKQRWIRYGEIKANSFSTSL